MSPVLVYRDVGIIIQQMHRNTMLPVHVCGNYNTTGAQECHVKVPCTGRGCDKIIIQVQRNTRLPVRGAAIIILQVQRNTTYLYRGAGEYQAAVQVCGNYNTNGTQEYQNQALYRNEAIGIKWCSLIRIHSHCIQECGKLRCRVDVSPTDVSPTENSWLMRPLNKESLEYCVPDRCFPTLDRVKHGTSSVGLRHLMDQWGVWPASPTPLTWFIGLAPLRRMHARPTHRTQI
jgi:hypothetical protein